MTQNGRKDLTPVALTHADIVERTRRWVDEAIIGLNLCPFAKAVQRKNQIRYTVSTAQTTEELADDLVAELRFLVAADRDSVDTTLLIHPDVLQDFFQYNDFLGVADQLIVQQGLDGVLQIASFHPDYQFGDAEASDPANYTNRSPFPLLHLLRESSVADAIDSNPNTANIYERNIKLLRGLSEAELTKVWQR